MPCLSGLAIEGRLSLTLSPAFPTNPPPSFLLSPYKNSLLICCGSPGYCVVTPGTPPPPCPCSLPACPSGSSSLTFLLFRHCTASELWAEVEKAGSPGHIHCVLGRSPVTSQACPAAFVTLRIWNSTPVFPRMLIVQDLLSCKGTAHLLASRKM